MDTKTNSFGARKRIAAITAIVLSLAIALGGTYIWQSMNETARNNARGMSGTAGGRLHDDYQAVGERVFMVSKHATKMIEHGFSH